MSLQAHKSPECVSCIFLFLIPPQAADNLERDREMTGLKAGEYQKRKLSTDLSTKFGEKRGSEGWEGEIVTEGGQCVMK